MKKRIIAAITGASGAIYGKLLLQRLNVLAEQVEVCAIVISENAHAVWQFELGEEPGVTIDKLVNLNTRLYAPANYFASIASGSAGYDAMMVCPCTMGTMGRIATGISSDLLTRAADVMLKERKRLVLVPREAPYNLVHLQNMKLLTEAGAIICPASPSFYSKPASLDELALTVVDRVLALAGFEMDSFRWGEHQV